MRQITPAISSVSRPSSDQSDDVAKLVSKMLERSAERASADRRSAA